MLLPKLNRGYLPRVFVGTYSPNRITFESIRRTCFGPELIAVEANAFPSSPRWLGGTPAFVTGRSGVVIWNANRMKKWDTLQSGAKRTPGNVMIHRHKTHIDTADEFQNGTVIPVTKCQGPIDDYVHRKPDFGRCVS
jgi:hypothetical protein